MKELITIRKHLHAHPEISGEEKNTSQFVFDELNSNCKADELKLLDCHALIARFKGREEGKTVMIRADMDALPIQEINDFEHKSKYPGKSHKCGHDGHTTILIGLARRLSEEGVKKGEVILLFQPAEETGEGAKATIADPYFKSLNIDFAFALHNMPGQDLKQIIIREKQFNAKVISMIIRLNGKTAHAAEPEFGYNPSIAISKILTAANEMVNNNDEADDFFLITPVHLNMGEVAYGISAGYGEIHFTIRAWDSYLVDDNCKKLEELVRNEATKERLKADIVYTQEFAANINDDRAVEAIRRAVDKTDLESLDLHKGVKWGEDFGLFTQLFPGAMFGLGSGIDCPALHNPDYDYPDEITESGITIFYEIIEAINSEN